ncbi:MAG: hypothetical protein KDA24_20855 [Deltaproteobacteria bacterium]|nr:hypothetical protein [Deltaproteobacteria bacterium]
MLLLAASIALLVPASAWAQEVSDERPPERGGRSVEAPGGTVVRAPQPVPPTELLDQDHRVMRMGLLLDRADVLDTFVARLARQARRVLDGEQPDCSALGTIRHALDLSLAASRDAIVTVAAELPLLPDAQGLTGLRERAQHVEERRSAVDEQLWPPLGAALRQSCPSPAPRPPTVWLPPDELTSVDGSSIIFVKTGEIDEVVWLDGQPAAVSDPSGWAVLVAPTRPVRLCVAPPDKDECPKLVEVEATPVAAFDLSD